MNTITLQQWCDFELFMISHNYSGAQIKAERAKCIIIREPITLKGDMANEFNDSQEDPDCFDEQDPMGL